MNDLVRRRIRGRWGVADPLPPFVADVAQRLESRGFRFVGLAVGKDDECEARFVRPLFAGHEAHLFLRPRIRQAKGTFGFDVHVDIESMRQTEVFNSLRVWELWKDDPLAAEQLHTPSIPLDNETRVVGFSLGYLRHWMGLSVAESAGKRPWEDVPVDDWQRTTGEFLESVDATILPLLNALHAPAVVGELLDSGRLAAVPSAKLRYRQGNPPEFAAVQWCDAGNRERALAALGGMPAWWNYQVGDNEDTPAFLARLDDVMRRYEAWILGRTSAA